MVILDLQKAFDTVNHKILSSKLRAMGVSQAAVNWFDSYLGGRMQAVEISGVFSEFRSVTCGVPQGSILGPLLFLIYVNDMKAAVNCKLLLYADDSALLASSSDVSEIEDVLSRGIKQWNALPPRPRATRVPLLLKLLTNKQAFKSEVKKTIMVETYSNG